MGSEFARAFAYPSSSPLRPIRRPLLDPRLFRLRIGSLPRSPGGRSDGRPLGARRGFPFRQASRGNLSGGSIVRLPCFFHRSAAMHRPVFPVHAVWPAICRRVASGQPLLPRANCRILNRTLRAAHIYPPRKKIVTAPTPLGAAPPKS